MPRITANGIGFEYELFGEPTAPPMLLVMGYSAQMIQWEDDFCGDLASKGFHVCRFDNRDVGLSDKLDEQDGYPLSAMTDDLEAIIVALGFGPAHLVGLASGGMIAQDLAARPGSPVASLCVINSTPCLALSMPTDAIREVFLAPRPDGRQAYVDHMAGVRRLLASPAYWDERAVREMAGRLYDRCYYPAGMERQMAAIIGSPDLRAALAQVTCPTLVIHGRLDPLTPLVGGEMSAAAIPDADLLVIGGMGHDLARPLWRRIVPAIAGNARRAL